MAQIMDLQTQNKKLLTTIEKQKKQIEHLNKLLKKSLQQSDYLHDIIAVLPGNIFWKDTKGIYLGCNNNVAKTLKLKSPKNILGKTNYDLFDDHLAELATKIDEQVINSDSIITTEEVGLNEDGTLITYLSTKAPLHDKNGRVIGLLGVSLDISDRKQMELLQNQKAVAEKTSRFMEMLAGSIAHELRTPLAILNINLDLLANNQVNNDPAKTKEKLIKDTIPVMKQVIKSATQVVDNILLTLRTMVSGEVRSNNRQLLSINDGIKLVLNNYPFVGDELKLIHWDKKNNFHYLGDEILTQHVLFNLIKNALRAIKESGKGKIVIKTKKGKLFNELIFVDNALGMPTSSICKIFDRFESNQSINKGAGLGLAFCKMVMESYGGDIKCESIAGKYTKFVLYFPPAKNNQ